MRYYIIRVGLENASESHFLRFIKQMEDNGYSIFLKAKDEKKYLLPEGNFYIESTKDKYQVLEALEIYVSVSMG